MRRGVQFGIICYINQTIIVESIIGRFPFIILPFLQRESDSPSFKLSSSPLIYIALDSIMRYPIHFLLFFLIKCASDTQSLPIVDKGVFVITGVKTCQNGLGYCILGNDCTVDKEFVLDSSGGHCDGLRKAFTPRTFFTCCAYNDLNLTTTVKPTTIRTTTLATSDVSLESNETSAESVESAESTEKTPAPAFKPLVGAITLDELLQNGSMIQLDVEPEQVTNRPVVITEITDAKPVDSTSVVGTVQSTESTTVVEDEIIPVDSKTETDRNKPDIPSPVKTEVESSPLEDKIEPSEELRVPVVVVADTKTEENLKPVLVVEVKPELEYVSLVDGDTKIVELKSSSTLPPVPEITTTENITQEAEDIIYLKEEGPEIQTVKPTQDLDDYSTCGIPQMKQKEIRVATPDSNEMNEQVGGDIGSCWLGGLVRSPTSLFSINDPGSYICSGALIGENSFLTSATCISRLIGNDLKLFRIILGTKHIIHPSNGVTYNGIYREIVSYRIHSNYSVVGQLRFHDIGIIHLKSRTLLEAFRQDEMQYCTLCLPRSETDFDKCIVSGYSHPSPSNGQDSDGIVHEAEQYIESTKYCESIINNQKLNHNYDGFTCASGVSNGEACFSPRDAGSPLACNKRHTSTYFIAGLFSSGFHCGTHDAPIIYTNIKQYLNWIYQNVHPGSSAK